MIWFLIALLMILNGYFFASIVLIDQRMDALSKRIDLMVFGEVINPIKLGSKK